MKRLALVTLVVRDYDAAIAFYCGALGFTLIEDTPLEDPPHPGGKRWVVVEPGQGGARLLLARAATAAQQTRVGDQTGGRVAFFLETDDLERDRRAIEAAGGLFDAAPRVEPYGKVAVFQDLYGNRWDLIEPSRG